MIHADLLDVHLTEADASDAAYLYDLVERTMRSYVEATWGGWREVETRDTLSKAAAEGRYRLIRVKDQVVGAVSVERQGAALESVIRSAIGGESRTVLDVACGIGTQSLGLAGRGFEVTASDVSGAAVERARREALQRGLPIGFSIADMRRAHAHHAREFDVVLCADNSLPHLISDEEISVALREFLLCTRPGGVTILSVRDYSQVERAGTQVKPHGVRRDGPKRYVLLQVWEWRDPLYDLSFYVVRDDGNGSCHTEVARSTYYAIPIPALVSLMESAGFVGVRRIDDVYFQPLVVGNRPDA